VIYSENEKIKKNRRKITFFPKALIILKKCAKIVKKAKGDRL